MDGGDPGETKILGSITLSGSTLNATGSSNTPVVNSITIRAVADAGDNNDVIRQWEFKASLTDDQNSIRPASELRDELNDAANDTYVTFWDIWGSSHTAQIIPPTPDEQFVESFLEQGGSLRPQSTIHMLLREVP